MKKCFYCGNNQALAGIAKSTGFRPDVAYLKINALNKRIEELERENKQLHTLVGPNKPFNL